MDPTHFTSRATIEVPSPSQKFRTVLPEVIASVSVIAAYVFAAAVFFPETLLGIMTFGANPLVGLALGGTAALICLICIAVILGRKSSRKNEASTKTNLQSEPTNAQNAKDKLNKSEEAKKDLQNQNDADVIDADVNDADVIEEDNLANTTNPTPLVSTPLPSVETNIESESPSSSVEVENTSNNQIEEQYLYATHCYSGLVGGREVYDHLPVLDISKLPYKFTGHFGYPNNLRPESISAPIMRGINGYAGYEYLIVKYNQCSKIPGLGGEGVGVHVYFGKNGDRSAFDRGHEGDCSSDYQNAASLEWILKSIIKKTNFTANYRDKLIELLNEGKLVDSQGNIIVELKG